MTATDLKNSLSTYCGGAMFVTVTEVAGFMGYADKKAVKAKYLRGLERVGKKYYIPDVAKRIAEERA